MKDNIYIMKDQVDSLKRERTLLLRELEEKTEELDRMKRIYENKGKCKNCSGGCPASEITGRSCHP